MSEIYFTVPGTPIGKGRARGAPMKATDDEIISAYAEFGSCKKVAARFGMCAQSVHERVIRLGVVNPLNKFTEREDEFLMAVYQQYADIGKLDELAFDMGRTKQFICRQAKRLGLTNLSRAKPYSSSAISARVKEWHKSNPHPRGALGMKHSDATRKILSEKSAERWKVMSQEDRDAHAKRASISGSKVSPINREGASWKAGWREIGEVRKYYRSRWEANYARYLQWLKEKGEISSWEHEPETFWFEGIKRGCMSYLPDFRVCEVSGSVVYHEVKGWMDDRSKTKIKRMAKYHPNVRLLVIDSKAYKSIARTMKSLIGGWE